MNISMKKFKNLLIHLLLAVLVVIWILPIIWIILLSFRGESGAYTSTFLPQTYSINNYTRLFTERDVFDFPLWFMNTLIVAIFSCMIATFYTLSVSYVMSRMRFKLRKKFMKIALVLGMFPSFLSMIAVYYILKGVGLTTGALKLVSLVLVYSGGAGLTYFVTKGFFDTIPKAIDEAAIIDGCTRWQVFTKITIPLSKPIIVQTIITAFMAPWLDFIFAKVIAGAEPRYYTVAIGLWNMLTKENITNFYTRFAAGAVLVSIPISILFLSVQKYYMEGNAGAVKG